MSRLPKVSPEVRKTAGFLANSILLTLVALTSSPVLAAVMNVTAKFTPDPNNPSVNKFVNTTPDSGYCAEHSSECRSLGMFSLRSSINASSLAPILANHDDERQGVMIKVPADFKELEVRSGASTHIVKVKISGFGATHKFNKSVLEITGEPNAREAHAAIWQGGGWVYAASPCRYSGVGALSDNYYSFFWKTPSSTSCGKKALFQLDNFRLDQMDVAYTLETPDPLRMRSGTYTGSIEYTVGPGADFDFGDLLMPDDTVLTFNFTLTVVHALKVQFPPGSDRLTLYPKGGWQQWLNSGRRPEKLEATQDFKLWSSTPLSIKLQCEHTMGAQCAIKNPAGNEVQVATRVTLPSGLLDSSNRPVNRNLLSTTETLFHPTYYVDNGRAALHFEVERDDVRTMIDEGSGTTYSGGVTVIFDSDIAP